MLVTLHLIIYLEDFALRGHWAIATMEGGPAQNLPNFQMAPIPFLSVSTCSTRSPHDILKVSKKVDCNLPFGWVERDIVDLGGFTCQFLWVFD